MPQAICSRQRNRFNMRMPIGLRETTDLGPCGCLYSTKKDDQPTDEGNGEVEMDEVDCFLVEIPPAHGDDRKRAEHK